MRPSTSLLGGIIMRSSLASLAFIAVALLAGNAAAQAPAAAPPAKPYVIPPNTPANIRRAVESPERNDEARARDFNRKPAEVLTLAGVKEGDHIIEIAGFGQYFTTMLVSAVGPKGMIDVYDMPYTERF